MATRRWGLTPGENEYQVTEAVGAAVVGDVIELTVDLATSYGGTSVIPRQEVLDGLDKIRDWILRQPWPPA